MHVHSNQKYTDNFRPIEHKCRQEGEKLKYIKLIGVINKGRTEFKDEERHSYPDVGRF